MKIISEAEAAELLGCARSKIRRLRLTGKIPYFPGRPPVLDAADVEAYIASEQKRREPPPPPTLAEVDAATRLRARRKWLRRTFRLPS